jgi:hypothetical protein
MRILLVLVAIPFFTIDTSAAVRYQFERSSTADPANASRGTVWIDEQARWRLELPDDGAVRAYRIVYYDGRERVAIDPEQRSWFLYDELGSGKPREHSRLLSLPMVEKARVSAVDVQLDEQKSAGGIEREHVIRLQYALAGTIHGNRVKATVSATIVVRSIEGVRLEHPVLLPLGHLTTGHEVVDQKLAEAFASIDGLIVSQNTAISRLIHGGPPMNDLLTTTISGIEEVPLPPTALQRPEGYEFRAPAFGSPGASPR